MKRTISVMVGKGSVKHNSRQFHAKNTDPERSYLNHDYCNENIKAVYHDLFDEALEKCNVKQTRSDRRIDDYYEKIRSGKQEKPFHEVILQIGNKDDMNAQTEDGILAAKVLDEYMQGFQERNPNLRVFSAHLHMDEATPHLHIDFVPFTTGSKRGLETRVSLKKALCAQGFTGGKRGDTEWNQWVYSEKEQLAKVMERNGIEWEQKGTHEKHLDLLNFEKKMRTEEVAALDSDISSKKETLDGAVESLKEAQAELVRMCDVKAQVEAELSDYDKAEWNLPEPPALMSAKAYKEKHAMPLFAKLKRTFKAVATRYYALASKVQSIQKSLNKAENAVNDLTERVREERAITTTLKEKLQDYKLLRDFLGEGKTDGILEQARTALEVQKRRRRLRDKEYER